MESSIPYHGLCIFSPKPSLTVSSTMLQIDTFALHALSACTFIFPRCRHVRASPPPARSCRNDGSQLQHSSRGWSGVSCSLCMVYIAHASKRSEECCWGDE